MESAAICEDRLQTICREGVLVGLLLHEGDVETRGIHLSSVRLRDSAQIKACIWKRKRRLGTMPYI